jgi:hypothetical protein
VQPTDNQLTHEQPIKNRLPDVVPGTLEVWVNIAGCGCNLHAIDVALLSLPGVMTIRWSPDLSFVTLGVVDRGPDDRQISDVLEPLDIDLFQKVRRP